MLTVEFDAREVIKGLKKVEQALNEAAMQKHANIHAKEIIAKAKASPIPHESGDLSKSSQIEPTGTPGETKFGFSARHATVQDQGMREKRTKDGKRIGPLRKKPHGSSKGPNQYFSHTVREAKKETMQREVILIQEALQKATATGGGG
jgi:hypothetical protein